MRFYEQQTTYEPAGIESARDLDEMVEMYDRSLDDWNGWHDENMHTFYAAHLTAFEDELSRPGSRDIEYDMADTASGVGFVLNQTNTNVPITMRQAAHRAEELLSNRGFSDLVELRSTALTYGMASHQTWLALEKRRDTYEYPAIRAAFDADVMDTIRNEIAENQIISPRIEPLLKMASSDNAYKAMCKSLDADVLARAKQNVAMFGPGSEQVDRVVALSPNVAARAAIRSALDGEVYAEIKNELAQPGSNTHNIEMMLSGVSGGAARMVFRNRFGVSDRSGYAGGTYDNDTHYTDFGAGAYDQKEDKKHDNQQEEPPKKEESKPDYSNYRDEEVERIVAGVEQGFGWLKTENPQNIRNVIDAVRRARAKWEAEGEPVTDRELWMIYRRRIEKGEQGGVDKADPAKRKAFEIVNALMDGKPSGKLPF